MQVVGIGCHLPVTAGPTWMQWRGTGPKDRPSLLLFATAQSGFAPMVHEHDYYHNTIQVFEKKRRCAKIL